jgi:hypothetical protein
MKHKSFVFHGYTLKPPDSSGGFYFALPAIFLKYIFKYLAFFEISNFLNE